MTSVNPECTGPLDPAQRFVLLPAVDLRGGQVVRLREGDFGRETIYDADPVAVALRFADAGATWLHVVDLDGARAGAPVQSSTVARIVRAAGDRMSCQVAGGLRDGDAVEAAFGAGAARVVVGTAALLDPAFTARLVARHGPERIVVALDVRDGLALGEAWRPGAVGMHPDEAMSRLADSGATLFAATAIDRDGLLSGPDLVLLGRLIASGRGRIIASGGVSTLGDLRAVRDLGCVGAIVGRAIYEGRLDLAAALRTIDGDPG
jgi:phosphoribosylformimino-5-aminoimidazole carboxamide ribotide isomerase